MKFGIKTALALLTLVVVTMAAEYKIGYVDLEEIKSGYTAFKAAEKEIKVIEQQYAPKLKVIEDSIKNIENVVSTQRNLLTEAKLAELQQKYQVLVQKGMKLQEEARVKLANKEYELTTPIMKAIGEAINGVAKSGKYSFILQDKMGVLYADPIHNVTPAVLKKLNAK